MINSLIKIWHYKIRHTCDQDTFQRKTLNKKHNLNNRTKILNKNKLKNKLNKKLDKLKDKIFYKSYREDFLIIKKLIIYKILKANLNRKTEEINSFMLIYLKYLNIPTIWFKNLMIFS